MSSCCMFPSSTFSSVVTFGGIIAAFPPSCTIFRAGEAALGSMVVVTDGLRLAYRNYAMGQAASEWDWTQSPHPKKARMTVVLYGYNLNTAQDNYCYS